MQLTKEKEEFIVNESKKTVTCLIHGVLRCPFVEFFTVSGVAKCGKDDKFNIETGKKLARSRANKNMMILMNKYIRKYLKSSEETVNQLKIALNKYTKAINREKEFEKKFKN